VLYIATYAAQRAVQRGPSGGTLAAGILFYLTVTVGLFALYVWLLRMFRRPLRGRVRMLALGLPVLYSLAWLAAAPVFSSDVFAYIAHGYVDTGLHDNPYRLHSSAVASSPLGSELWAHGWRPVYPATPYGPLVTHLETTVVRLAGGNVTAAMLLFKLVAVATSIGSAALIWWILQLVRPQDRDLGTLAYLWNPAVILEVAGEGHNDSLMAMLVLLSLGLTVRRRVALATVAMSCAVLTKYLPLLIVPLQLGYLLRVSENKQLAVRRLAGGVATGLALAVALFAPFWMGVDTFNGADASAKAGHTGSTQTLLVELLSRMVSEPLALRVAAVGAAAALVAAVLALSLRVRTTSDLLRTCAVVVTVAMLWIGPAYWPWYVILPVALLALVPYAGWLVILVAVSLGSRLAAPLNSLYIDGVLDRSAFFLLTWVTAVALPLLVLLAYRLSTSMKSSRSGRGEARVHP